MAIAISISCHHFHRKSVTGLFADQGSSAALNIGGAALERRRARVCKLSEDLDSLKDSQ